MDKGKTCFRQKNMCRDLEVGMNLVCMRKKRGKCMEQLCFPWTLKLLCSLLAQFISR